MTEVELYRTVVVARRFLGVFLASSALFVGYHVGATWPWWATALVLPVNVVLFPLVGTVSHSLDDVLRSFLRFAFRQRLPNVGEPR